MNKLCKVLSSFSKTFNPGINGLSKAIFLLFILFLNKLAFAQPSQPTLPQYSLGLFGGPTITYSSYGEHDTQKHFRPGVVVGYNVGGFVKFPLKNRYSFITDLSFAQKGRTTHFNENWTNKTIFRMVDADMALRRSFRVKLKKDKRPVNIFVGAGPNIEYILNAHGQIKVTPGGSAKYDVVFNGTPDSDFSKDYYNDANRWLFGLDFRVGGDAQLFNNQTIYIEARFTWGQTFIGKKTSSSYMEIIGFEDDLKFNLKTFSLLAYYSFDFDLKKSRMGKSSKDKEIKRRR